MTQLLLGLAFDIFSALSTVLSTLFSIFITLASTATTIIDITDLKKNIYIILTVIMVFYVTISLMTYLVSPDKLTDKSVGGSKLIIKIIITLVLLVFTPTLFSISRDLQTAIIKENILGKIIISDDTEYTDENFRSVSHKISEVLVLAFLRPTGSDPVYTSEAFLNPTEKPKDEMYGDMFFAGATSMNGLRAYAQDDAHYSFNWLMAILCTGVLCLIVFGFLFDIAVRLIKLSFMELIAPIPIISNIASNKNDTLNKWGKSTISTYASLFIRLIIIFFFLYVITNIDISIQGSVEEGVEGNPIIYTFVIIGALLFAKELPKLLQDMLGIKSDGNFTLNPMKRIREVPLLGSAVQTVGAAAGGLATGASLGFKAAGGFKGIVGAFKDNGFKSGMKNLGTMTGMSGRGMIFGGRAGFKQTKLMGVAAKDQNLDKGAYRAGASSVAQAITGNSDASAGFPDRFFNNMATHLNEPSYKQAKVIGDAEKDYEKAAQLLATLQDSQREIHSKYAVADAKLTELNGRATTINSQISAFTANRTTNKASLMLHENTRIDTEISDIEANRNSIITNATADVNSKISQANRDHIAGVISDAQYNTLISQYNTEKANITQSVENSINEKITNLQIEKTNLERTIDNRLDNEYNTLINERNTVNTEISEATAVYNSYSTQKTQIDREVSDQVTAVAGAKQHVKDEKDKLKKMQGPYNKNK